VRRRVLAGRVGRCTQSRHHAYCWDGEAITAPFTEIVQPRNLTLRVSAETCSWVCQSAGGLRHRPALKTVFIAGFLGIARGGAADVTMSLGSSPARCGELGAREVHWQTVVTQTRSAMKQTPDALVRAPTDLSNYLSCRHQTALDLRAARGEIAKPVRNDAFVQDLRERGLAHERAYLDQLRAEGRTLAGAEQGTILTVEATLAAMRSGIDVIYQAALEHDAWSGRADFLLKVNDAPSRSGAWSYEACDTKLARETKAGTILQLCVYS